VLSKDRTFCHLFEIGQRGILRVSGARSFLTFFPTDDLSCCVNVSNSKDPARSITYFEFISEIMEDSRTLQLAIPLFCEWKSSSFPAPAFLLVSSPCF